MPIMPKRMPSAPPCMASAESGRAAARAASRLPVTALLCRKVRRETSLAIKSFLLTRESGCLECRLATSNIHQPLSIGAHAAGLDSRLAPILNKVRFVGKGGRLHAVERDAD